MATPIKQYTVEERRSILRALEQSGLSATKFAASRGMPESTLQRWRQRQRKEPVAAITPVDFVRLVPAAPRVAGRVVVEVGSARILVEPGFDAVLLREVVAALTRSA